MISNLFNIEIEKDPREGKFDEIDGNNPSFQDLVNRSKENTLAERIPGEKAIPQVELNLRRPP